MRARVDSLSPRALALVSVLAVVLYTAVVWFLLVSPKRSEVATARSDLAAAEVRLSEAQTAGLRPRGAGTPVADVSRLAKAMPASADQPGLVLELSRLAQQSGVTLRSITPQEQVAGLGGPTLIPLTVTVGGNYRQITNFLLRTRSLVAVRDGEIRALGRLLAVQSVSLAESDTRGFPNLNATVALNAYVYDGPIVAPEVPAVPEDEETSDGTTAAGSTD